MTEIERKIMEFLVSGKAYSDGAVMKNLGITSDELNLAYNNLLENGYIESFDDYLARTNAEKKSVSSECSGCSGGGCSGCGTAISPEDYHNVKVITAKALLEFEL